jgi:hypothetical protein
MPSSTTVSPNDFLSPLAAIAAVVCLMPPMLEP